MVSKSAFATAFALALLPAAAPAAPVPPVFAPVAFLLGDWTGSGTSDAGAGKGGDTFRLDLQDNVVVRRSHSEYPGKDGKPGVVYDALMVIYKEPAHAELRADYFDNGHVIHYSLAAGSEPNVARFVSDAHPGEPVFRLTYGGAADGKTLEVKFEIEPPGAPAFSTLADGVERRAPAKL